MKSAVRLILVGQNFNMTSELKKNFKKVTFMGGIPDDDKGFDVEPNKSQLKKKLQEESEKDASTFNVVFLDITGGDISSARKFLKERNAQLISYAVDKTVAEVEKWVEERINLLTQGTGVSNKERGDFYSLAEVEHARIRELRHLLSKLSLIKE